MKRTDRFLGGSRAEKKRMRWGAFVLLAACLAAVPRAFAGYDYLVETNDTVVTVSHVAAETTHDHFPIAFLAPDISRVVYSMNGEVLRLRPPEPSTYTGGTEVLSGQMRILDGGEFGTGPIVLGSGTVTPGLLVADASCTVTNKIVFSNDVSWAMSADPKVILTVNRLAGRLGAHGARFGRSGNPSSLVLDLAEDGDNEPLNCIALRGALAGTLGGTLKMTRNAKSPFVRNTQPEYSQELAVAPSGLVVDAPAGVDVRLATNVVIRNPPQFRVYGAQVVLPDESSFENGGAGWSCERVDSASGANIPGVVAYDDATWVNGRVTPFGDKVMVLRTGHRLTSPVVEIPTNGVWQLNFWRVGRKGYSGWNAVTEVAFENVDTGVCVTNTIPKMTSDPDRFVQTVSPSFELAAGRYRFSLYPQVKGNTTAMLYDNFAVEETKLVHPENGDFETGAMSGWAYRNLGNPSGNLTGVYVNGNEYNVGRDTPFGKYSVLVRTGHELTSPAFEIPEDGTWRLNFWRVGRKGYSGSSLTATVVFTDVDTGVAETNKIPGFTDVATYQQTLSPAFDLHAGRYTFSISTPPNGTSTMFYDHFAVEKVEVEQTSPGGTVTKRGAGRLVLADDTYTNPFVVDGGALSFVNAALEGVDFTVSSGTLELGAGVEVDVASRVAIAAGAGLQLSDQGENLILNGSFERNGVESGVNFKDGNRVLEDWVISCVEANGNNGNGGNNGGVQGNGGNITPTGPLTDYGTYTATIREHCRLTQTVSVTESGNYELSFVYATRRDYGTTTAGRVLVDEEVVIENLPKNPTSFVRQSAIVALEPGDHTLAFEVYQGNATSGGPMMLFDDVGLRRIADLPDLKGRIELSAGSTLELFNSEPLELEAGTVYVNGREFQGSQNALAGRGVVVRGEGRLHVGHAQGTMMILR